MLESMVDHVRVLTRASRASYCSSRKRIGTPQESTAVIVRSLSKTSLDAIQLEFCYNDPAILINVKDLQVGYSNSSTGLLTL